MLVKMWRKRTLVHCWWEFKLAQPLWKTVWKFVKKLKIRATIWSCNSTLGYLSEQKKTIIWKEKCTPMFIAALFTIAKTWTQPKCPSMDEWIKTVSFTHPFIHFHLFFHANIHSFILTPSFIYSSDIYWASLSGMCWGRQ